MSCVHRLALKAVIVVVVEVVEAMVLLAEFSVATEPLKKNCCWVAAVLDLSAEWDLWG